ncbi:MAG TPA: glycosyl hydrolase family 18 protein, partial [Pyrinomonadaceae bacterium]|nr:glycosyl hydrolase family 18 protein [Pyrinomonadaceae bacterium]
MAPEASPAFRVKGKSVNGQKPVFFDDRGHRRRFINLFGIGAAGVVTIAVGFFVASVLINPFLPQLKLKPIALLPQKSDITPPVPERPALTKKEASLRQASERVKNERRIRDELKLKNQARREMLSADDPAPTPPTPTQGKPLSVGFYVNWDYSSYSSLSSNIDQLDWLVPEWIRLSGDDANPLVLDIDDQAMDLIHQKKPDMPVLPLVQNYKNEQWNTDILVKSVSTEESRQKLIAALLDVVAKNNFGGLTIDIEEVPDSAQTNLFLFVSELHQELQKRNLVLAQAMPFDNPDWNYRAFASVTDYLMLMAYDQHWSDGEAGPVSGEDWFESILKKRMEELSPAKTILCVGNYGYNWSDQSKEAETVSFQDSLVTAKESLDSPTEIKFDPVSKNPYYTYDEDDGSTHTVWFLDAITAYNQIHNASAYNLAGFALWRLGSEDPSIWKIFGKDWTYAPSSSLASIQYGYDVDFDGTGEILQVKAVPQ